MTSSRRFGMLLYSFSLKKAIKKLCSDHLHTFLEVHHLLGLLIVPIQSTFHICPNMLKEIGVGGVGWPRKEGAIV
jgi:hypothetical protein